MEILKGQVQWNGRDDIPCTYGKTEDGKQYYFMQDLKNGNHIVTTSLLEAVDSTTKPKNVGLIDENGSVVLDCSNSSIKTIDDELLLVEPTEPVSDNVKEANTLRTDPLSATRLVSTPAQIKAKIPAKDYLSNNQFSEVTITDISGNNLINGEYYSFVARDNDKLYMAKNYPETDVVEFSIPEKKLVEEVSEVAPEEVAETVKEDVVEEVKPVENINEGFAKEDIDLGQEVTPIAPAAISEMFSAPTQVSPEEVAKVSDMFTARPVEKAEVTALGQEISIPKVDNTAFNTNSFMDLVTNPESNKVGSESFDEIKEDAPVTEINSDEVAAEVENKEITDEDLDSRESDLSRRLDELNSKFSSMNESMSKIEAKEEPVEEENKTELEDIEEPEEYEFSTPELDSIDKINDEEISNERVEDNSMDDGKNLVDDASRILSDFSDIIAKKDQEISEINEDREELTKENNELRASLRDADNRRNRDNKEINFLKSDNEELRVSLRESEADNKKLRARIDSLTDVVDLYKRKDEETKRNMKTLARAIKNYEALSSSSLNYDDEDYRPRRVA